MGSHTILSLDLGTTTGWVEIVDCVAKRSGSIKLPGPDVHPGLRFIRFSNWLQQFKNVDEIFYEDVPRFASNKAARVYSGLLAVLLMFCAQNGISFTNIKAVSVKCEFAGNGHAKKDVMCDVAHRLGWKGGHPSTDIDHDECDAIACGWVILNRREEVLSLSELKAGYILEPQKRRFIPANKQTNNQVSP